MPRLLRYFLSLVLVVLLFGGPLAYTWYLQSQVRNFRVVKEEVLYRSGQMSLDALKRAVHDYGIKTVVTLRDAVYLGDPPPDLEEEKYCHDQGLLYYRISPRTWWSPDGSVPAEKGVRRFRNIMDKPDHYPVLIHCFAGIHRTGAFCAIYRMEYEHWSNEEAIEEMRVCGYNTLEDEWDLLSYLEQYRPRWKRKSPADTEHAGRTGDTSSTTAR
jgi:protein tyrosine/serine phosphatase